MNSPKPKRGTSPHHFWDAEWLALRTEEVIDAARPIVDPHHHLWHDYYVPQLVDDLRAGHNITGTVYIECTSMYRADGDPRFASVGEVEYANGVAAQFASGFFGPARACAGIVGRVDLTQGAAAADVLQACMAHAPERFRGLRQISAWDASPEVNTVRKPPPPGLLMDAKFREGFALLGPLGLSFDVYCYHPQLHEVASLADQFPGTPIIVDHCGGRVAHGPYATRKNDVFRDWQAAIADIAKRPNVFMKFGGLNMRIGEFDFIDRDLPPSSTELADAWRPYFETCMQAFGAPRTMFESNFPPDKCGCSYRTLWNAFKRLAAGASADDAHALFAGTAIRVYRLPEVLGA